MSQSEFIVTLVFVFAAIYFFKRLSIVTKLYKEVAGYDSCIVKKYQGNSSKGKVSEIVKNTIGDNSVDSNDTS